MHSRASILKVAVLSAGVMTLGSCREGRYQPDTKFVDLYAELKLASVASTGDPSKANEVRRVILAQNKMTPAQFHEHFVQLADHPESWKSFQENVINRIDALQKEQKGVSHGR